MANPTPAPNPPKAILPKIVYPNPFKKPDLTLKA